METNWKQNDEAGERLFEKRMDKAKHTSAAARVFFSAGQEARRQAKENGFLPARDNHGELRYTIQQGLKAACHAREDISANLQIQFAILQRLDRNRNLLFVIIILLAYVAFRLS
jgi:hypothetical protein